MKQKQKIRLKIPHPVYEQVLMDLKRPHAHAYERVGFLYSTSKLLDSGTRLITFTEYHPVHDDNYIEDNTVGAKINSTAIRESMQRIHDKKSGCFHVHLHDHPGVPSPSETDQKGGIPKVIESFANVNTEQAHGILIFSEDSFYAAVKVNGQVKFITPEQISVIGYPMKIVFPSRKPLKPAGIFDRQSFLGKDSQFLFENVRVGIVGVGGGGSHIVQQLAHIGVRNITIVDDDKIEASNLNRLIGGWFNDLKRGMLKTEIAKRLLRKILPSSKPICINAKWQNCSEVLQECDIILGCIDSYAGRQQLEAECRRYLIPYIDIGMDVYKREGEPPYMSGQVILSMPGMPCMTCLGFLTEKKLAQEAAKYGDIGGNPQVVWSNGVLASSAVGVFVDIVTGWTDQRDRSVYLSYDGNLGTLGRHIRLDHVKDGCAHYPIEACGRPTFSRI